MKKHKYALYCAIRALTEAIVTAIVLLIFFSLIGCKTPVSVERSIQLDSISVRDVHTISYDSLISRILSSLSFDFEYKLLEWSAPDSIGNQHIEKEHSLKGSVIVEKNEETTNINTVHQTESDSTRVSRDEAETITPTDKLSWWQRVRISLGNWSIIMLIPVIGFLIYKGVRFFK